MQKLSVRDLDLQNKKVLIRVDFNVPVKNGIITNDSRIRAAIPTIEYVLGRGGSVILMSHLGRPEGQRDERFTLKPCALRLSELMHKPVKMASDCIGFETRKLSGNLKPGEILLLENLRFHKGEEKPSEEPNFVDALASQGDIYVDDAFGAAHREHASIVPITRFFPETSAAGLLLQKEITYLGEHLASPARPFCAILGGSKISTKFRIIQALMNKADTLLIGGAMANTFFKAEHISVGQSPFEPDYIPVASQILDIENQSRCRILLPVDLVIAESADPSAERRIIPATEGIPDNFKALDIGPQTIQLFISIMKEAATVFWNGPLGVFECPPFDRGTRDIALAMSQLSAVTIVGGGDSMAAVEEAGVTNRLSHVSTGGGASLEYMEQGKLPGVEVLTNKK